MEKFCCRFKTVEVANSFHAAFMKAKVIAKAKEDLGTSTEQVSVLGVTMDLGAGHETHQMK